MLKKISTAIGFTATETMALVFLLFLFFTGLSYKYFFLEKTSPFEKFDYSIQDSIFNSAIAVSANVVPGNTVKNKDVDYKQEVLDFNKQNFTVKKRIDLLKEKSINLNKANLNDLIQLPGIGEATAENIIKYREMHGDFRKLEELMNVKRIGDKRFNQIKKYLFIE